MSGKTLITIYYNVFKQKHTKNDQNSEDWMHFALPFQLRPPTSCFGILGLLKTGWVILKLGDCQSLYYMNEHSNTIRRMQTDIRPLIFASSFSFTIENRNYV